jgi:preprotein translocase subunit SecA
MDYLQEGIGLRAMARRDPLVEYQREGYELFAAMMDAIKEELASLVFNVEVTIEGDGSSIAAKGIETKPAAALPLQYTAADENGVVTTGDVSRNSPCPCGSGKKYKRCHGAA